jgi:hypothetical protein
MLTKRTINYFKSFYNENIFYFPYTIIFFVLLLIYNSDLNTLENLQLSIEEYICFFSMLGILIHFISFLLIILFFPNIVSILKELKTIIIFVLIPFAYIVLLKLLNIQANYIKINSVEFINLCIWFLWVIIILTIIILIFKIYTIIWK